ncbi:gliding motility lipoprotein GldD [Maribacter algarum]|uniref:Gliding motility lipoprotein GldD n=1 Tax=Maribacter algarum (ex Zhang et al. 2020) TaxID=2578118 RepID=A0A5S3Q131_9FLAO|nr:gliding motility lipoprotein GldD [Maribacter algarum]TMM59297.1 gliding motility lipoprotein GldD [Maribacter algarum]
MRTKIILAFLGCAFFFNGCGEENVLPKPKAMLRLEYQRPTSEPVDTEYFTFDSNLAAQVVKKNRRSIIVEYPEMKAAIFLSYRNVRNDLNKLIRDAHKLSGEHAAKADGIQQKIFENTENKVYGAFYEVSGDAASQAQFFVTDSLNHFVTGALYFKTKPNYDSIYPAAKYLQNDMGRIMESLRWKDKD